MMRAKHYTKSGGFEMIKFGKIVKQSKDNYWCYVYYYGDEEE
jgi:hypothetical protein